MDLILLQHILYVYYASHTILIFCYNLFYIAALYLILYCLSRTISYYVNMLYNFIASYFYINTDKHEVSLLNHVIYIYINQVSAVIVDGIVLLLHVLYYIIMFPHLRKYCSDILIQNWVWVLYEYCLPCKSEVNCFGIVFIAKEVKILIWLLALAEVCIL